jgi:hypothetical protein
VNIYDPMDRIVYRHLDQRPELYSVAVTGTPPVHRLPAGYANLSPRTYLRSSRRLTPAA